MLGRVSAAAAIMAFCITSGNCQLGMAPGIGMAPGMGMASMLMRSDMSPQEYMILDNAVKQIVGPTVSPDPLMIMLASQKFGSSSTRMLTFVSSMQSLARRSNVQIPGVIGTPTAEQINNHVYQQAIKYIQQRTAMKAMGVNPLMATMMPSAGATGATGTQTGMSDMLRMMATMNVMGDRMNPLMAAMLPSMGATAAATGTTATDAAATGSAERGTAAATGAAATGSAGAQTGMSDMLRMMATVNVMGDRVNPFMAAMMPSMGATAGAGSGSGLSNMVNMMALGEGASGIWF